MIKFNSVTKKYHYDEYPAIENLSFCVPKGETTTLLIERQSGKTTIAKLLVGIVQADSGSIQLDGKNIDDISLEKRNILYLPSEPLYFPHKSVYYNLAYPYMVRKISKAEIDIIVDTIANKYGYDDTKIKANKLSNKQLAMLPIARASKRKLDLVIFDDCDMMDSVDYLEGKTVLALTSSPDKCVGNTIVISNNQIVLCGTKEEAKEYTTNNYWLE